MKKNFQISSIVYIVLSSLFAFIQIVDCIFSINDRSDMGFILLALILFAITVLLMAYTPHVLIFISSFLSNKNQYEFCFLTDFVALIVNIVFTYFIWTLISILADWCFNTSKLYIIFPCFIPVIISKIIVDFIHYLKYKRMRIQNENLYAGNMH